MPPVPRRDADLPSRPTANATHVTFRDPAARPHPSAQPLQGVFTLCDPTSPRPWQRAALIDEVVDHITVAEAAQHGALAVLHVIAARCEMLGVPDATVSEVLRSWLACRAT